MSLLGRRSVILAAVVVLSLTIGAVLSPQTASPVTAADPVVRIDPASTQVAIDDTIDVDIVIADASNLYSASVHISFDPAYLEVVDIDPGRLDVQLIPGRFPCPSEGPCDITKNIADNSAGTIEYDATLNPPASPVEGSGVLATIHFHALAAGASAVTLESATLWDRDGIGITTVDSESGEVVVADAATATPEPTSTAIPTSESTATRTPTGTPRGTNTPAPTRTAKPTNTPKPTATPKSTATPKPPKENPEATKSAASVAAAGTQPTPTGGALPSAGTGEMPAQMWRWFFLSGAVVMGLATWAFTFRFYARQKENERFWHR
jgi:hypothetical protein